jgi:hypothetical protein
MTAIYRISQGASIGSWGRARQDLQLFGVGGSITFEAQDVAHTTYLWELISEPEGSAVALTTPTATSCTADILVEGGYLMRLTVDAGLATEDIVVLYAGVPLPISGLPIPAFNETYFDNSQPPFTGERGYEAKLTAFFKWLDLNAGGGVASPWAAGAGVGAIKRVLDLIGTAAGDYALNAGLDGEASTDYSTVTGRYAKSRWYGEDVNSSYTVDGNFPGEFQNIIDQSLSTITISDPPAWVELRPDGVFPGVEELTLNLDSTYIFDILVVARKAGATAGFPVTKTWKLLATVQRDTAGVSIIGLDVPTVHSSSNGDENIWDVRVIAGVDRIILEVSGSADGANPVGWQASIRGSEICTAHISVM